MAQGDWAPGTKARTLILNITTDEDEVINHVGIGYHLVAPSGRVIHQGGWTWHGPAGKHGADPELIKQLQATVDRIRDDLAAHEGLGDDGPGQPMGRLVEVAPRELGGGPTDQQDAG